MGGAWGTCTPIERAGEGGGRYTQVSTKKGGSRYTYKKEGRIGTGTHIERGQVRIEGPGMLAIDYKPDL